MKLLFVTSTLTSGGSERVMSLLANKFSESNDDVEIVCLNKHVVFYPINQAVKLVFIEEFASISLFKKLMWLRAYIKQSKADVVIPFMEAVYCVTLLSMIGLKIPVVSSERIDPRQSPFFRNILRRIFLPLTTHLVVQTQEIKDFYPSFIRKKTSVIFNPVTEKVYGLKDVNKENIIISVGKLDAQKNHKMLIYAFSKVANDFPEYKLVIYGEGPLRADLESLIKGLNLSNRILLPGRNENIIEELNRSRLFCFSSDYEGMSNAVIEAICVGLPVITTKVSGMQELIHDGENGLLVSIGDVDGMANAMRRLLGNEEMMKSFTQKNKLMAFMFKMNYIFQQWESLLSKIVRK